MNQTFAIPQSFVMKFRAFYILPIMVIYEMTKHKMPGLNGLMLIAIGIIVFTVLLEGYIRFGLSSIKISDEGIYQISKIKTKIIYWDAIQDIRSNTIMQRFTIKGNGSTRIHVEYQTEDIESLMQTIAKKSKIGDKVGNVYAGAQKKGSIYKYDVDSFKH